ncbi:class I SAM-dependent methyltransferase [Christiangramia sp. LLG6405-1]|uniref:class I SAM-dependent methyltransferase n=1 Tax=Christiangramia sp. LLG6405-1 TaxID=3160832 RepID=UPI003869B815
MIKKVKKKLKKFIDVRVRLLRDQQHQNQQVLFNHSQLKQLFSEGSFIPFSGWAISPSTILHVLNDVAINKRKCIIEFGSGASTFYIAKLLKVLELNAVFYSVESDEKWANEMKRQLQKHGISEYVRVIYAPLRKVSDNYSLEEQETWYDTQILEETFTGQEKFDLILVDGPFGGSTPYARYSAIPFLRKITLDQASIFLDDVQRADEAFILKEWEQLLDREANILERYGFFNDQTSFDVKPFQLSRPTL